MTIVHGSPVGRRSKLGKEKCLFQKVSKRKKLPSGREVLSVVLKCVWVCQNYSLIFKFVNKCYVQCVIYFCKPFLLSSFSWVINNSENLCG